MLGHDAGQNRTKNLVCARPAKIGCEMGDAGVEYAPTNGETNDVSGKFPPIFAED